MRKQLGIIGLISCFLIMSLVLMAVACSGTGNEGDAAELGYNFEGGAASIPASGSLVVTHSITAGTPTSVQVTNALAQSGSLTSYSVTAKTATTFKITSYVVGSAAGAAAAVAGSGSVTWMAKTD